jgi:hypothetical protein
MKTTGVTISSIIYLINLMVTLSKPAAVSSLQFLTISTTSEFSIFLENKSSEEIVLLTFTIIF